MALEDKLQSRSRSCRVSKRIATSREDDSADEAATVWGTETGRANGSRSRWLWPDMPQTVPLSKLKSVGFISYIRMLFH